MSSSGDAKPLLEDATDGNGGKRVSKQGTVADKPVDFLVGELQTALVPNEYIILEDDIVELLAKRGSHEVWITFFGLKTNKINAEKAFQAFTEKSLLPPNPEWRGPLGECVLHPCFLLMDVDKDNMPTELGRLAEMILGVAPQLLNAPYYGEVYTGETCLHLAVAKNDINTVKWLLHRGADMEVDAHGKFFKRFLWGEDPVSWAACSGKKEILELLLAEKTRRGNNIAYADTHGNTVLHNMVRAPNLKEADGFKAIYNLMKGFQDGAVAKCFNMQNENGMTPLQLSAADGNGHFGPLMECVELVQWKFGDVVCSAHPLQGWDSAHTGEFDDTAGAGMGSVAISAIELAINHKNLAFFSHPLNKLLILHKWKTFVLINLLRRYVAFTLFVVLATVCVNLQGDRVVYSDLGKEGLAQQLIVALRVVVMILALIGIMYYGWVASRVRRTKFYQQKVSISQRILSMRIPLIAGHFFIFAAMCLRMIQDGVSGGMEEWVQWAQELTAPPGMLICWFYMAEILMLNEYLGSVSLVVWEILQSDLPAWIMLQGMLLLAFASTLNFLYNPTDFENGDSRVFDTFEDTVLSMLFTPFGDLLDVDTLRKTDHDIYVISMYFFYAVLSCVLTLNLSIALFTERMSKTMQNIDPLWLLNWANLCVLEEKQMQSDTVKSMRCGHQLKLTDPTRYLITQRIVPSEKPAEKKGD